MAASHGLFEEDGVFWFYADTCQVNTFKDLLTLMPTCRVWLSLHRLFSAHHLLGTYLLTTYTYMRMRLLTRVYGMEALTSNYYIYCNYCRLLKSRLPFLHTTLREMWEGGICSNVQFVPCIRPSLCSSQSLLHARLTITTTAAAFWKNGSFDEHVLQCK